jgi:hypothetical protein
VLGKIYLAFSVEYQGITDNNLPLIPIEPLRQYDNYQIYDLIVRDIANGSTHTPGTKILAVQAYSPTGIGVDFIQIAKTYK